jgi:hypothetical protein
VLFLGRGRGIFHGLIYFLMEIFEYIIANFWTFTFSTNIQEVLKNQFLYLQLIDQDGMTGLCTNDWQR